MRSVLWVLAVVCSLLALMLSVTTYVPRGLVGGMWTVIAFAVTGIICAIIAATMRPRRTIGLVSGGVLALVSAYWVFQAAVVIARH